MIEAFWIPLLPPYLIGLVLSFAVEALLTPRPVAPWRRPMAAVGVHVGVWTLAMAFELLLFRRPYFAVANVLAIQLIVVLVNNAKFRSLREPFVFQDFEYFTDALRHPRLYLPFVSAWVIVLPAAGYAAVCHVAFRFEPSLLSTDGSVGHYALMLAALTLGGLLLCAHGRLVRPEFDARADLVRFGLFSSLISYWRAERTIPSLPDRFDIAQRLESSDGKQPDMISIQSESFFDARQTYPVLRQDLLAGFDALRKEALVHGALTVPAWGANTVRTEFAFLCGQPQELLGVHRFNPYRRLAVGTTPSFVRHLRDQGYRTVCIHPYHAAFYRRDRVMPILGFDEFIDLTAFSQADQQGQYVGDNALADKVIATLQRSDSRPLYVHVITMENHGPLHLEAVSAEAHQNVATQPLPEKCRDLVAYAGHLRNADQMFTRIANYLRGHNRPASLCIYGDHVPIMADVYRALGEPSGTTSYLIWHNRALHCEGERSASIECLAGLWLGACYQA